jgi:hypothetical protein
MGNTLTFPSSATHTELVLPYGAWLTDARLSSLGFSTQDIQAIRRGEPIGRVVARGKGEAAHHQPAHRAKFESPEIGR